MPEYMDDATLELLVDEVFDRCCMNKCCDKCKKRIYSKDMCLIKIVGELYRKWSNLKNVKSDSKVV